MSVSSRSQMNPSYTVIAVGIVIITILVITSYSKPIQDQSFQIITVGPLWNTDTWSCQSSSDYIVYGLLHGLDNSQLAISISGLGKQSIYSLIPGHLESFTVGSPAGHQMNITKTGMITGWITLQTAHGAKANCTQT
jgi:hypothetical protein